MNLGRLMSISILMMMFLSDHSAGNILGTKLVPHMNIYNDILDYKIKIFKNFKKKKMSSKFLVTRLKNYKSKNFLHTFIFRLYLIFFRV